MPSRSTAKVTSTSAKTLMAGASSGSFTRAWVSLRAKLFLLQNRNVASWRGELETLGVAARAATPSVSSSPRHDATLRFWRRKSFARRLTHALVNEPLEAPAIKVFADVDVTFAVDREGMRNVQRSAEDPLLSNAV